jgi:hypothetical protein
MEKNVKVNNVTAKNVNGKKEKEKNVKVNNVTLKNVNGKK